MQNYRTPLIYTYTRLKGAIILEFIIAGTLVLSFILGVIQLILIYTAYLELEQATFEAARTGSVTNAQKPAMLNSFARNIIELYASGSNPTDIANALVEAQAAVRLPLLAQTAGITHSAGVKLDILNPTREAFADWGALNTANKRQIENTWQNLNSGEIGATSQVSLEDANILKIQITYGYPLQVPLINRFIANTMMWLSPENILYYTNLRLPLVTTATIHMQSHPIEDGNVSLDWFENN